MSELVAAFVARLPVPLPGGTEGLAAELAALVERAQREAPGVVLDPLAFLGYAAERVALDARGMPKLQTLRAGDLWIAFGCTTNDPTAIAAFTRLFLPDLRSALHRAFDRGLADDAELKLMDKLFLAGEGGARLASYGGRGALGPWLRAVAIRAAIDLMRARRELPTDPAGLDGEQVDPLLASLKQRYRDEFRTAFREAAAELTDRDRTLLQYKFVEDLSVDEIGAIYRVHRATVARWIAVIRESLFEGTRARLMARFGGTDSDIDSVLRLIDSQLDASLEWAASSPPGELRK